MVAVRLDDDLIRDIDRERRRRRLTRASAIRDALTLWVQQERYGAAVRRDQEGYADQPVSEDEFGPVLGAQQWPR
jgi:Arc/MetJ-type ribon-helix-helix transcriptional regulator